MSYEMTVEYKKFWNIEYNSFEIETEPDRVHQVLMTWQSFLTNFFKFRLKIIETHGKEEESKENPETSN